MKYKWWSFFSFFTDVEKRHVKFIFDEIKFVISKAVNWRRKKMVQSVKRQRNVTSVSHYTSQSKGRCIRSAKFRPITFCDKGTSRPEAWGDPSDTRRDVVSGLVHPGTPHFSSQCLQLRLRESQIFTKHDLFLQFTCSNSHFFHFQSQNL